MAVAMTLFLANLVGLGSGPFITGLLSDLFKAWPAGLHYALVVAVSSLLPTGVALIFHGPTDRA